MTPVFCMAVCWIAMLGFGLFAEPKPCKGTNFFILKKKNPRNRLFNICLQSIKK